MYCLQYQRLALYYKLVSFRENERHAQTRSYLSKYCVSIFSVIHNSPCIFEELTVFLIIILVGTNFGQNIE